MFELASSEAFRGDVGFATCRTESRDVSDLEKFMTLHPFTIISAIAKRGNLTDAALDLRKSHPALTHQMKLLQESYGTALYAEDPRALILDGDVPLSVFYHQRY